MSEREVARLRAEFMADPTLMARVTAEGPGLTPGAVMRCAADIQPEPVRWLWPGRFPLGKLSVVVGDPGLGKSLLTLDIAARVSAGRPWPDGGVCEVGSAILLSAEDDASDTVRPRLDAAGANVLRVHLLEAVRAVTADGKVVETTFNLEQDSFAIADALTRISNVRLVVIDPISAYLGGVDSHSNAEVRGVLAPLAALAAKHGAAILAVSHLRKSPGAALHRAIGSVAFAAAARSVWAVAQDPDAPARRLMLPVKQNLAPDNGGLAYQIEAPNGAARISWQPGTVAARADEVLGGFETGEEHSERREAEGWLCEFLADGPKGAAEIKKQIRQAGLSWATIRRAADAINVRKAKSGFTGGWEWSLPEDAHPAHSEVSTFEHLLENKGVSSHSQDEDAHRREVSIFEGGEIEL